MDQSLFPNKNKEITIYIVVAVVAFMLGFGSGGLYMGKKANRSADVDREKEGDLATIDTISGMLAEPNAVVVNGQTPGVFVSVAKAVFEKGGWVVIHEDDGSGKPGKILGAQLFDRGSWENGKVELLRGTVEGGKYFAMLHSDNGDRAFDPKLDTPIVGKTGSPIMMEFMATGDAGEVPEATSL